MNWPFDKDKNVVAVTTIPVHKNNLPILSVSHYLVDNSWAFTCGSTNDPSDSVLLTMEEIISKDNTLLDIFDLPPGWMAIRKKVGGEWYRHKDNDLLKKAEHLAFMKHGSVNAKLNIFKVIQRNIIDLKTFGWCLFILHIFMSLGSSYHSNSKVMEIIALSLGAFLNIIAIVGLIMFITKEKFRNEEFFSKLIPFIGCLLLWLLFIGVFLFYY